MSQTAILTAVNTCFGNKIIEGFRTNNFILTSHKKPVNYNFSFYSNQGKDKPGGVLIRVINPNDVFNDISITELYTWANNLRTKKEGDKYAPYGPDYLCLVVVFNGKHIEPNILHRSKFYYTENDIKLLYQEFVVKKKNKQLAIDVTYNQEFAWEVYRDFRNKNNVEYIFNSEFKSPNCIGKVVFGCMNYNPISCYDAANHYFTYAEENIQKDIKDRGLTKDEMIETAIRFSNRIAETTQNNVSMSIKEAFHYIMYYIINKTFIGYYAEKLLSEALIKQGYLVFKIDDETDQNYGIDLRAKKGNDEFFIQVKSKWFLQHLTDFKKQKIKELYNKTLNNSELNLKTYYAFYNVDEHHNYTWDVNLENNSYLFDIKMFE